MKRLWPWTNLIKKQVQSIYLCVHCKNVAYKILHPKASNKHGRNVSLTQRCVSLGNINWQVIATELLKRSFFVSRKLELTQKCLNVSLIQSFEGKPHVPNSVIEWEKTKIFYFYSTPIVSLHQSLYLHTSMNELCKYAYTREKS